MPSTNGQTRGLGKPRRRGKFRYADHSKPTGGVPKDDRTISRSAPTIQLVRPAWNGKTGTTLRVFPSMDPESGEFEPYRDSPDPFDFTDWTRGYPAVKYVGLDSKYTFLLYDPRDEIELGYDRSSNPYIILYNAILDAVKEGEALVKGRDMITAKWAPLTVEGKRKSFNAPTMLYYMQGTLYEHNGNNLVKNGADPVGLREDDPPQIIQVSKTGGQCLAAALNLTVDGYKGDTDEYNKYFVHGDITDLVTGRFVTVYNPEKHDVGLEEEEDGSSDNRFKGWKVLVEPDFTFATKRATKTYEPDISRHEKLIKQRLLQWDDILHVPPHEEICLWLAQAFRSMPDLLYFGWADNPEFFTDEVEGVLANRAAAQVGNVPELEDGQDNEPPRRVRGTKSAAIPAEEDTPTLDVADDSTNELAEFAADEYDELENVTDGVADEAEVAVLAAEARAEKRGNKRPTPRRKPDAE